MAGGSRIALGTAQLGMAYGIAHRGGPPEEATAHALLAAACALGIRCVDTAPAYGASEARIGRFLRSSRAPIEISTKLEAPPPGLRRDEVEAHVEASVDRSRSLLGADTLSFYLIHAGATLREHGHELIDALVRQQKRGAIGRIGLSVYDPEELELVRLHPEISAVQYPFNVFDRRFSRELLGPGALPPHVVRFARSPLLQGLFSFGPDDLPGGLSSARPFVASLRRILVELKLDPISTALSYAVQASGADYVILGAETADQLRGAMDRLVALEPSTTALLEGALGDVPAHVRDPRRWRPSET